MNDEIIDALKELKKLNEEKVENLRDGVELIINNNVKNIDLIEHTLDSIMSIPNDSAEKLFYELCDYYFKINKENANFYRKEYKKMWS